MWGTGQDGKITVGDVRRVLDAVRRARTAGEQSRVIIRDGAVHGCSLRAGGRGATWWVEFKPPGRDRNGKRRGSRHLKLGDVQALSPNAARQTAARVKHEVLQGRDPCTERKAAQAQAVAECWADVRAQYFAYLQHRLPNPRSRQNEISYIEAVFHVLNPRSPLRGVELSDVFHLLQQMPAIGVLASQRLAALGRLLDWARVRGVTDMPNPVRLLPRENRPRRPAPRKRALSLFELGALWRGAGQLMPLERDLLRLLIALPLRKSEAAALEWGWIDRDAGTVSLPAKLMKNGEPHTVPLGEMAREVLDTAAGATWPVTGRIFRSPNARVLDWARCKRRIDEAVPLPAWTFHDCRRSFVSALAEHGHSEPVLDQMLAHRASSTRTGVLAVYQVARRLPEQRAAMTAWDKLLNLAIHDNVIRLKA